MTGGIRFLDFVSEGEYGTFRDPKGYTTGFWYSKPKRINGVWIYSGEVRIFNQTITFALRKGDKGSKTFMLYPSRIFLDRPSSSPRRRRPAFSSTVPCS